MATPLDASASAMLKIIYHVLPRKREVFERTLRSMVEAGATSSGRLGVDVLKPAPGSAEPDEWQVVLRYRTEADLCAWRQSRAARTSRAHLDALTVDAPQAERMHGMETWFSLSDRRDVSPPPKWKMAIVSIIAIYPLILFLQPALAPLVRGAPKWLAILIEMSVLTPLMTWVILPLLIRLLKPWLYPQGALHPLPMSNQLKESNMTEAATMSAIAKDLTKEQTMKAIRIHSFGGPEVLEYEDVPRPTPSGGQVLIRLHAASVNPVEGKVRAGAMQKVMPVKLPYTPGSDLAGVIESVGAGVTAFTAGQEVYGWTQGTTSGTYAEYVAASTDVLIPKPPSLSFSNAASIPVVSMTAWQALFVTAGLAKGQSVLIHGGAGGVGMYAVQLAKWKGAHVTATASAGDIEFVKGLGADKVIDYKADRFEDKVSGVDVVLDLIGGETQQRSWQTIKPGGILVATPAPPSQEEATRHGVRAVMVHMQGDRAQLSKITELIATGAIKTFVGATFPLADARKAQQASESGHVRGKIVLEIRSN